MIQSDCANSYQQELVHREDEKRAIEARIHDLTHHLSFCHLHDVQTVSGIEAKLWHEKRPQVSAASEISQLVKQRNHLDNIIKGLRSLSMANVLWCDPNNGPVRGAPCLTAAHPVLHKIHDTMRHM